MLLMAFDWMFVDVFVIYLIWKEINSAHATSQDEVCCLANEIPGCDSQKLTQVLTRTSRVGIKFGAISADLTQRSGLWRYEEYYKKVCFLSGVVSPKRRRKPSVV